MEHGEQRGGRGLGGMTKTILSSRICVDVVVLHRKGTRYLESAAFSAAATLMLLDIGKDGLLVILPRGEWVRL